MEQKIADNIRISGGCGVSLPNLETSLLENGQAFLDALASKLPEENEGLINFNFDGETYSVFNLAVKNLQNQVENDVELSPQQEVLLDLEELNNSGLMPESLKPEQLSLKLDRSDAKLVHYAASLLPVKRFEALVSLAPNQLKLSDHLGQLAIHAAALAGNVDVVAAILDREPLLIDAQTLSGTTALIHAINHGQLKVVELLLKAGANANLRLPNGLFPLFLAIQNHYADIALALLHKATGLNLNEYLDSHMTSLHLAVENRMPQVVEVLIEKGANLTLARKYDGFTAYHLAVQQGELELIKKMIAKGVSPQLETVTKKTALHLAAEAGQFEVLCYLLEKGLSADAKTPDGDTALMLAIQASHRSTAEKLAQVSAIDTTNAQGKTASHLAVLYNLHQIADCLLARGENPCIEDKQKHNLIYCLVNQGDYQRISQLLSKNQIELNSIFEGESLVAIAARNGHFLIISEFFRVKPNVPYKTLSGLELIHYAVLANEIGFLRKWLSEHPKRFASPISSGLHQGQSLAYLAALKGSFSCFELLLSQLSSQEIEAQKLLIAAIEGGNIPLINHLLIRWPNVNQPLDKDKNTALHLAVSQGSLKLSKVLKKRGADFKACNQRKETVFHLAMQQENEKLLKCLLKLSEPSEWPADLWQLPPNKLSFPIVKVLNQFRKQAPVVIEEQVQQVQVAKPKESVSTLSTVKMPDMEEWMTLIKEEAYEEALEWLEKRPDCIRLFQSPATGGPLFMHIFKNLSDYSSVIEALKKEGLEVGPSPQDVLQLSDPGQLLAFLAKQGVDPSQFKGKSNVLLSMIRAENDKDGLYRFDLLAKYFPKAIPSLAQEELKSNFRVIQLAPRLKKSKLFKKMDEFCVSDTKEVCGLHEAVLSGDRQLIEDLLQTYPVDSVNNKKQTALMLAASLGNVQLMDLFLQRGALPERVDIYGQSALHYALIKGDEEAAFFLLPKLRNTNKADFFDLSPLAIAAQKGLLSVVRFLCEETDRSQEVNHHQGWTALHVAAMHGQVDVIKSLVLDYGFVINQVEAPLKSSKSPKRSPLHLAALRGHVNAVEVLLDLDKTLKTNILEQEAKNGYTLIEYAGLSKNSDMLRVIQQFRAYHEASHNSRLLEVAARANHVELASELILDKVNLNSVDKNGFSVLHWAAIHNAAEVAELVLQGGEVEADLRDCLGQTPLHHAAKQGHVRLIEILLRAGANINALSQTEQASPLFMAASSGKAGAVAFLLKFKADPNLSNHKGLSPAQVAMANGHNLLSLRLNSVLSEGPKLSKALSYYGIYRQTPQSRFIAANSQNQEIKC